MNKAEMARELEWVKKQSRKGEFTLPEREPDELPATESQIAYLKTITKDLDEGEMRKLGEKQVSVLIDKTKVKRDAFTNELIAKRLAQKSGCMSSILISVVLYVLISQVFS